MPLRELSLHQVAVFQQQRLSVPLGMTVLAGEAGAGKSLITDALDWVFGASVSAKDVLRQGCDKGQVGLLYECTPPHVPAVWQALEAEGIDVEETAHGTFFLEMIREFSLTGSRFRLNGTSVSRAFMQGIRPYLMELQGQHSTVTLMQSAVQEQVLDAYGGVPHHGLLQAVQNAYRDWKAATLDLERYESQSQFNQERVASLRLQQEDLEEANVQDPQEDAQLEREINRLAHAESLQSAFQDTLSTLGFSEQGAEERLNVLDAVGEGRKRLQSIAVQDPQVDGVLEQLDAVSVHLSEVGHILRRLADGVELNPHRLDALQSRLNDLQKIKRLYGPSLSDVLQFHHKVKDALEQLDCENQNPQRLKEAVSAYLNVFKIACDALTQSRQHLAQTLESQVALSLQDLAMPHATFKIELAPLEAPAAQGQERVQFLFSANPGDDLKPLGKVASGGELSRVLLALTVASLPQPHERTDEKAPSKLYIFDEIDTGTSGQAAKTIGQQLQRLAGAGHQVLVVTHQAVVAAAAHQHWWVHKVIEHGEAKSHVQTALSLPELTELLTHMAMGVSEDREAFSPEFAENLLRRMQPTSNSMRHTPPLVQ
ncbi:MAG: hypothetical protein HEQ32_04640 [Vampirovibrio sp.]